MMKKQKLQQYSWLGRGLTSREHASGYIRRPCNGHEMFVAPPEAAVAIVKNELITQA